MPANLQDRADAVRKKIEVLNGDDSITLLVYLFFCLDYNEFFVEACENWIKEKEEYIGK